MIGRYIAASVIAMASAPAHGTDNGAGDLFSTKNPYHPPVDAVYSAPPEGFEPFSIQHVGRHGSRLLSSLKYDDLSLQLWELARAENGLTELGEDFGPLLADFMALHEQTGYGNLSEVGEAEHVGIALRAYDRMYPLFSGAVRNGQHLDFVSSGQDRAMDSGLNFIEGLVEADVDLADVINEMQSDPETLYFHKSDDAYQAYKSGDTRLHTVLDDIALSQEVQDASYRALSLIYTDDFLGRLANGEIELVDGGKGETFINDIASAADSLYNLFVIAPGAAENWDFSPFMPEEAAESLVYYADAQQFYEKGPGFEGEDITFAMAAPLLADFFDRLDAQIESSNESVAAFRFAHGEQIIPLAALMQLPGSQKQAAQDDPFTYENNDWRGNLVAPMAANIQWDVFSNGERYIVRMLYNETEIPFAENCSPTSEGGIFYDLEELRRCLPI